MNYTNKTKKLIISIFIIFLLLVCLNNVSATDNDNSKGNGNDTGNITANITLSNDIGADNFDVNITSGDQSVDDCQDTNSSALYNLTDVPTGDRNVTIAINSTVNILEENDALVFNITDGFGNPITSDVIFYLNNSVYEAIYDDVNKLWFITGLNSGYWNVKINVTKSVNVIANSTNDLNLSLILNQLKVKNEKVNITIDPVLPAKNGDISEIHVKVTDEKGNPIEGVSITISINGATGFSIVKTNSYGEAILNHNYGDGKYYQWWNKPGVYPIKVMTFDTFINGINYTAKSVDGSITLINNYTPKIEVISKNSPIALYGKSIVKVRLLEYYPTKKVGEDPVWAWHPISGAYIMIWLTGTTGTMLFTDANGYATYYFDPAKTGWAKTTVSYSGYHSGNITIIQPISKEISIYVTPRADLLITNVKKITSTKYKITVKNNGEVTSQKSKLKVYYNKGRNVYSRYITVKALAKGKSITITVKLNSNNKKYKKYAVINYNHKVLEYNYDIVSKIGSNYSSKYDYSNDKISFKSDYIRYKADLAVTALSFNKKTNIYTIHVKNKGNKIATGKIYILFWYGSQKKPKSPIRLTVTLKKIKGHDTRIQPGMTLNLDGLKYPDKAKKSTILKVLNSKYKKYVYINFNKKLLESNYKNNLKGFKKSQINIVS
ncbi:Ig-like domain-containing protein [Methanobrevibacter arboriphilus]|nr:Ig-like domain-containing protein [Methanobrevibacter arboriphilus]